MSDFRGKFQLKKATLTAFLNNENFKNKFLLAIPFWIASFITGLVAVGYSKLFNISEHLLQKILSWHSWLIFILAPLCFCIAWFLVRKFSTNAKGSGIPQVMAAISTKHDSKIKSLLSLRIIIVKIISSCFMVLGGAAIGREGPTIQIGASIFSIVNKIIPSSWPKGSHKNFILTGAAAGLAAAFNTPLGGIVFAIEELARVHISFFRTALFTAVIISGLTAQAFLGPYLYLGHPEIKSTHIMLFFWVAISAIVSGVLGSLMCKGIIRILKWKKGLNTTNSILYLVLTALCMAIIAFSLNSYVLGSGNGLINEILFSDNKSVSWHTMLLRIVGPVISFTSGAAGGVFAPSLAAGAAVGGFVSGLFNIAGESANIIILSGMVGFLTGVTRTPFTSAILVLEMTDRHNVIFHLMLAAVLSNMVAFVIDKHSLYEQLKKEYDDVPS